MKKFVGVSLATAVAALVFGTGVLAHGQNVHDSKPGNGLYPGGRPVAPPHTLPKASSNYLNVPEGGSAWLYVLLSVAACSGSMLIKNRKTVARATNL